MASERQIRANRRNAKQSTGPRTARGKAIVRNNALKHGLLARTSIIPGEDEALFEAFADALHDELQPDGHLERLFADRAISCAWRLRRAVEVDAGVFTRELYGELADRARHEARSMLPVFRSEDEQLLRSDMESLDIIGRSEWYERAITKADDAETIRDDKSATLGQAFIRDACKADALSKLSRYEISIERSLIRALEMLWRLQEKRTGSPVEVKTLRVLGAGSAASNGHSNGRSLNRH